jgi:hypothetical protein
MKTLDEQLAEIEARADKATKGPWLPLSNLTDIAKSEIGFTRPAEIEAFFGAKAYLTKDEYSRVVANQDFIAHSRTDVPGLIAALKLAIEQRNSAIGGLIGDPHLTVESIEIDDKELQAILEGER